MPQIPAERWRPPVRLAGVGLFLAAMAAVPARGQTLDQVLPPDRAGLAIEPDVTVQSRLRPAYDPLGVRAGAFILHSNVQESAGYDTNVVATSPARGSPIFETTADVSAVTQQSRGSFDTEVSVDDVRYTEQPSQSHTNWTARLGGSYDVGQDILAVNYAHLNQSETLKDLGVSQQLSQALAYRVDDARVSYRAELARAFVVPALEVTKYNYDNLITSGIVYTQSYLNRVVVQPSVTLGYELAPRRNLILVVRGGIASYDNALPGLPRRNYDETSVLGGIDYDLSAILRFRALVGYQFRTFNSSQYKNVTAPILEASLIWNPTGLTTVTGTVSRIITDSTDTSQSTIKETQAQIRVDHEYYRNILLQANAIFAVDEYPGGGDQTLYGVGVGATYLINRNMDAGATYNYSRRSAGANNLDIAGTGTGLGPGYSDNLFQLRLRLRL